MLIFGAVILDFSARHPKQTVVHETATMHGRFLEENDVSYGRVNFDPTGLWQVNDSRIGSMSSN